MGGTIQPTVIQAWKIFIHTGVDDGV